MNKEHINNQDKFAPSAIAERAIRPMKAYLEQSAKTWKKEPSDDSEATKFKPFDRVLVKLGHGTEEDPCIWVPRIYSYYDEEYGHALVDGSHRLGDDIVPFEGNEHLIGKIVEEEDDDNEPVEIEEGEYIFACDDALAPPEDWRICKFEKLNKSSFMAGGYEWKYCVPFVEFNPDDMDSTKEAMLLVHNNKFISIFTC